MKKKKMKDKPIKEQYQDKAQEVLERSSKMETKTLSDKIGNGGVFNGFIFWKDVKDFIKKLKEEVNWRIEQWHNDCPNSEALFEVTKTLEEIRDKMIDKLAGDDLI